MPLNVLLRFVPTRVKAAIAATAINAAISAYSIAVTPDLSSRKFRRNLSNETSFRMFLGCTRKLQRRSNGLLTAAAKPRSSACPWGGSPGKPVDQKFDQCCDFRRPRPPGRRHDIERDRRRGPVAHDRFELPRPKVAPDHEFRLNRQAQTRAQRWHQCVGVVRPQWSGHSDFMLFAR